MPKMVSSFRDIFSRLERWFSLAVTAQAYAGEELDPYGTYKLTSTLSYA